MQYTADQHPRSRIFPKKFKDIRFVFLPNPIICPQNFSFGGLKKKGSEQRAKVGYLPN